MSRPLSATPKFEPPFDAPLLRVDMPDAAQAPRHSATNTGPTADWLPLIPALDVGDSRGSTSMFWSAAGDAISRERFAAGVLALAERLPAAGHAVNLCEDRYAFCTALAAAALRGIVTLLPPSAGAATIESLRGAYPDALLLRDAAAADRVCAANPSVVSTAPMLPDAIPVPLEAPEPGVAELPVIAAQQLVAFVFTSGSTGQPQPHGKTWRSLFCAGQLIAERLLPAIESVHTHSGLPPPCEAQIVATVPMQHMYGLETAALLPMSAGFAVHRGRPVLPEDVRAALAALPGPRVLVTAPVHIRALLAAGTRLPALAAIISATAPLSTELAARAETAFGAPLFEIYGCTEAGSIATRRSVTGAAWRLLSGMRLTFGTHGAVVSGAHLQTPILLQDRLEAARDGFRLRGRSSDLLKVGGRRASLSDLTQKLLSIPGIVDGVIFLPKQPPNRRSALDDARVQRPAALVVAPSRTESEILAALARLIDPIFLPRPLRKLDSLPRNAVGKLPQAALEQLLAAAHPSTS